jgi:hypothetical protein
VLEDVGKDNSGDEHKDNVAFLLVSKNGAVVRSMLTNSSGNFSFLPVEPGSHVSVELMVKNKENSRNLCSRAEWCRLCISSTRVEKT